LYAESENEKRERRIGEISFLHIRKTGELDQLNHVSP